MAIIELTHCFFLFQCPYLRRRPGVEPLAAGQAPRCTLALPHTPSHPCCPSRDCWSCPALAWGTMTSRTTSSASKVLLPNCLVSKLSLHWREVDTKYRTPPITISLLVVSQDFLKTHHRYLWSVIMTSCDRRLWDFSYLLSVFLSVAGPKSRSQFCFSRDNIAFTDGSSSFYKIFSDGNVEWQSLWTSLYDATFLQRFANRGQLTPRAAGYWQHRRLSFSIKKETE